MLPTTDTPRTTPPPIVPDELPLTRPIKKKDYLM